MATPIASLSEAKEYVLVNGLYYAKTDLGDDTAISEIQHQNPQYLIVRDLFLDEFMQNVREKNLRLEAVPLAAIPTLFTEGISIEGFDPKCSYVFDSENGRLWEEASLKQHKAANKNTCPISNKPLDYTKLIQHPFAIALAAAMKKAKKSGQSSIDLNQVFNAAISGNIKLSTPELSIKSKPNVVSNNNEGFRSLPNWITLRDRYIHPVPWMLSVITFFVLSIFILMNELVILSFLGMMFYGGFLVQHTRTNAHINHYKLKHKAALLRLGVKPRSNDSALVIFNFVVTGLIAVTLPIPLAIFFALSYFVPTIAAGWRREMTLATAFSFWRAKSPDYYIPPVPSEIKKRVALRTGLRLGILAGIVTSVYFMPLMTIGIASAFLGPIGAGIFCLAITAIIVRVILNDYISMRIKQLHPVVEAIEATPGFDAEDLNPSAEQKAATAAIVRLQFDNSNYASKLSYKAPPEFAAIAKPEPEAQSTPPQSNSVTKLSLIQGYSLPKVERLDTNVETSANSNNISTVRAELRRSK